MDGGFMLFAVGTTFLLAAGGVLVLVGYISIIPAAFAAGWQTGLITLLLPGVGPVWFGLKKSPAERRAAWQVLAGLMLAAVAGGLIYNLGPGYAKQLAIEAIEQAEKR